MRSMLTDDRWTVLEPIVIASNTHKGGSSPTLSDGMFLEALLYVARTSIPWRDLPGEFGQFSSVYNRFRRWVASGRLRFVFEALATHPLLGDVRRVMLDSTVIRAHLHAAGAPRKKSAPARRRLRQGRGLDVAGAGSRRRSS